MQGHVVLSAVAKLPVYRKFSSELYQGRHPPNLAQLHHYMMRECLNIDVAHMQKLVEFMPNQTVIRSAVCSAQHRQWYGITLTHLCVSYVITCVHVACVVFPLSYYLPLFCTLLDTCITHIDKPLPNLNNTTNFAIRLHRKNVCLMSELSFH